MGVVEMGIRTERKAVVFINYGLILWNIKRNVMYLEYQPKLHAVQEEPRTAPCTRAT